jgi:hypothetical protein
MDIPKPKKKRLSIKEKIFVQEVLKPGVSQTEAYLVASPNVTRESAKELGHRMMERPHVQEHINQILEKMYPETAKNAADVIMEIMNDPETRPETRLKCVEILAKLKGWNAPTKTQNLSAKVDMSKFKLPGSDQ